MALLQSVLHLALLLSVPDMALPFADDHVDDHVVADDHVVPHAVPHVVPEQRGFHSHSMAHDPKIKKEMAEARKIAREDVDDALE